MILLPNMNCSTFFECELCRLLLALYSDCCIFKLATLHSPKWAYYIPLKGSCYELSIPLPNCQDVMVGEQCFKKGWAVPVIRGGLRLSPYSGSHHTYTQTSISYRLDNVQINFHRGCVQWGKKRPVSNIMLWLMLICLACRTSWN